MTTIIHVDRFGLALLFWWFLLITWTGAPQTVGPFKNHKQCEAIAGDLNRGDVRQSNFTSACWSDEQ